MRIIYKVALGAAILVCLHCQENIEQGFLIGSDTVGPLHRTSSVEELESLYAGDSIVKDSGMAALGQVDRRIQIFEKGGKPLLLLTPGTDSLKRIESIRILDPRYQTIEGVGLNSTFAEIRDNYTIRKIVTSLNNVIVFVKGKDYYFTISREELPASLRYNSDLSIEEVHIPDEAKIKYLMVGWDH